MRRMMGPLWAAVWALVLGGCVVDNTLHRGDEDAAWVSPDGASGPECSDSADCHWDDVCEDGVCVTHDDPDLPCEGDMCACEPSPEVCDGVDNDCNGIVDEACDPEPCASGECGPALDFGEGARCDDGSTPPTVCERNPEGLCAWRVRACEGSDPEPEGCRGADDCGADEACVFPFASCGEDGLRGHCVALNDGGCGGVYEPVCGCDGQTYSNACVAELSGASIASAGECISGDECPLEACGELLPPERWECADGSLGGPTGRCLSTPSGECAWEINECGSLEPIPCGGRSGQACPDGWVCFFPIDAQCGVSDIPGVCGLPPEGCPHVISYVCGCDGQSYGNECEAYMAGVSVSHAGACEMECPSEACGPAPGMPNWECADGSVGGPACMMNEDWECAWVINECEDEDPCALIDCPPGLMCVDGACVEDPIEGCWGVSFERCDETPGCQQIVEPEGCECPIPGQPCNRCIEYCAPQDGISCGGGTFVCGGECVELISDPDHCGACGASCPTGADCVDGACFVEEPCGEEICGDWLDNDCDGEVDEGCDIRPCARRRDCRRGEFCHYALELQCGAAGELGVCRAFSGACDDDDAPVCGCDGQTYPSECYAYSMGVSILSEGECR